MRADLAQLLQQIHRLPTPAAVADLLAASGRQVLRADAVGFALMNVPGGDRVRIVGLPDAYAASYRRIGRSVDPVLAEIVHNHAATSTSELFSAAAWHSHPLYVNVASRFGLQHIMAAPVIGPTGVIGKVSAGRRGAEDSFLRSDLSAISVIAAHASVAFCVIADERETPTELTARELQIVRLVAAGKTNADIGHHLGVSENTVKQALKSVFRKTGIHRRVELAALCASWQGASS